MANNQNIELVYQTGIVKILHKRWLSMTKAGIDECIKNLKNSYLNSEESNGIKLCSCDFKYYSFEFEEILNEIRKISIVGLYHTWERHLKMLLIHGSTPETKCTKIIDKFGIEKIIAIYKQDENCNKGLHETFDKLRKYSTLNNTIKHGTGFSYTKLYKNYKEFFYDETYLESLNDEEFCTNTANPPIVTEEHIQELYDILIKFWNNNPKILKVNLNFIEDLAKKK